MNEIHLTETESGVTFAVRVVPGSSRDALRGIAVGALRVAVTAAPEKGKANKAVVSLLAKALGCKKSRLSIVAGKTSRDKRVLLRTTATRKARAAIAKALSAGFRKSV